MNLFEAHHGFWGLLIMLAGFAGIFYAVPVWLVLTIIALGMWVFLDDVYQHIRQRTNPKYLSPLHNLFYEAVRWFR